ncbi:MAG TPA: FTR1 family protein [Acetobacteraceae bacterium]|nr:FTR1 family protein [Acetobacteraceae bacterium]
MLAAMLIVFREMIEAGLIVGIVLAASRGVPRRGRMVTLGVAGGVAGACAVAAFAGRIAGLFAGSGQELFDTAVLLAAIAMLTWHNVWMAGHGRSIAQDMRRLGTAVSEGRRPLAALGIVVGIAVLREGAEAVLFLYGIATSGGTSIPGMMLGGALGVAGGAAMAALIYAGLLAIPAGRLLAVTGWLITLLAAGMASQAVAFLQQAGYAQAWSAPLWDTSWLLRDASLAGRLLHTLIGYTAQPDAAQLAAYLATIVMITALARAVRPPRRTAPAAAG